MRAATHADADDAPPHGGRLLVVGCGNSELSAQLYDDGFTNVVNIDFSKVCIAAQLRLHLRARPAMKWLVMDATAMKFEDGSFDTVVDKGALDALMGEPGPEADTSGGALLRECCRVTHADSGNVLIVSLLQAHVLTAVLAIFRLGWRLSITQVPPLADMSSNKLQPFLVVARAMRNDDYSGSATAPSVDLVVKDGNAGETQPPSTRCVNAAQLADIRALIKAENERRRSGLASGGSLPGGDVHTTFHPGRTRRIALGGSGATAQRMGPRFMATVVDAPDRPGSAHALQACVFLVPQGREHEWLFAHPEGNHVLASNCSACRVVIVCLGRGHTFGTSADVQAELSPLVIPLLPSDVRHTPAGAVPFMTMAEGLGSRALVAVAESELSGTVLVEDVTLPDETDDAPGCGADVTSRRLIFTATPTLLQSEMRVVTTAAGRQVDLSHLCCAYHAAIVAGLGATVPSFASSSDVTARIAIIGLGGGALPLFLVEHFPHVATQVVELDPIVAQLAQSHFKFNTDTYGERDGHPRLGLTVGDGLQWVADCAPGSCDALIVDASSNDASLGMTCPPAPFVESQFVLAAERALSLDGCLVFNVVTRSASAFEATVSALKAVFPCIYQADTEDDVNRVLFARKKPLHGGINAADVAASLDAIAMKPWDRSTCDVEALATGVRLLQ